jgi:hypothetical protein
VQFGYALLDSLRAACFMGETANHRVCSKGFLFLAVKSSKAFRREEDNFILLLFL